jgi:ABC-2 type transport system ATP-binding protein
MSYANTVHSTKSTPDGVYADSLSKSFGDVQALREASFHAPAGSVLGLLGHNGAGKTTAVRILTTLALPTSGRAFVAGFDPVAAPAEVRARIGLTGQSATVDGLLSARANLELVGRLYHLPRAVVRKRAGDLLAQLRIEEAGDRLVRTFSGGMRRRLDLAASLVASPPVLFLDEPTTGLDPQSRNDLWELLSGLVEEGMTLVLTTQYLEEADRFADRIVLLDHGQVTASGTPAELKARVGGERLVVTLAEAGELPTAAATLAGFGEDAPDTDAESRQVTVAARAGTRLIEVVRALDAAGVDAVDVQRREVTLDDVFLSLTHKPAPATAERGAA